MGSEGTDSPPTYPHNTDTFSLKNQATKTDSYTFARKSCLNEGDMITSAPLPNRWVVNP